MKTENCPHNCLRFVCLMAYLIATSHELFARFIYFFPNRCSNFFPHPTNLISPNRKSLHLLVFLCSLIFHRKSWTLLLISHKLWEILCYSLFRIITGPNWISYWTITVFSRGDNDNELSNFEYENDSLRLYKEYDRLRVFFNHLKATTVL